MTEKAISVLHIAVEVFGVFNCLLVRRGMECAQKRGDWLCCVWGGVNMGRRELGIYTTPLAGWSVCGLRARLRGCALSVGFAVAVLFGAGLGGCGSSAPVPPRQMVGNGASVSSSGYGVAQRGWNTQVQSSARAAGTGGRSVVRLGHRPKGGGTYKVGTPYLVKGKRYVPGEQPNYVEVGLASWYGRDFDGKATANGEVYDMRAMSAAHKTLPMPSYAYVTNLTNNRTVLVRVNDRGPFKPGRIIDLSERAARELGFKHHGLAKVRVRYAGRAPLNGNEKREREFLANQSWHRHAAR